jgi:hypothetical protein
MAISRAQLFKELLPGLNKLFGLEYAKYENEHTMVFSVENSDRSFEEEQKLSGFGAAGVKMEGAAINYDHAQEAWTARYTHETIAMGFAITEEAIEDNLYDQLSARYTKGAGQKHGLHQAVKAAAALNGFSGSFNGGDGRPLLDNAHPLVAGGVNSNIAAVPTDLNETALENAVIDIAAWTDERGLLIAARPRKLIIAPAGQFIATRVLQTEQRVDTANNDINALKSNGAIPEGYGVMHYLTDLTPGF